MVGEGNLISLIYSLSPNGSGRPAWAVIQLVHWVQTLHFLTFYKFQHL